MTDRDTIARIEAIECDSQLDFCDAAPASALTLREAEAGDANAFGATVAGSASALSWPTTASAERNPSSWPRA